MTTRRRGCLVVLAIFLAVGGPAGGAAAQPVDRAAAGAPDRIAGAAGEEASARPSSEAGPRVTAVHRLLVEESGGGETAASTGTVPARPIGLGAVIAVEVAGLDELLVAAGALGDVVLFLDGIPLAGLEPLGLRRDRGWLIYRLDRTEAADAAWHLLLGSPSSLVRRLALTVGPDSSHPLPSAVEDFPLAVVHGWELGLFTVLLLATLIGFAVAARRTDLLRDRAAEVPAGAARPYSLARCQMAWWFFLVVAAYVFIWLALAELDTITGSVVALVGIGAGTALGAGVIDAQKKQGEDEAAAALAQARQIAASAADSPATPDVPSRIAQQMQVARMAERAAGLQGSVKGASRGFWRDLLWDGAGISLHRFQIVVWTLVLGTIFVASVYGELAMPEFSATLLALMGISSGTYLGFKFPERQQP